jgi:uroporphyrinogen decarboxylase-like protein
MNARERFLAVYSDTERKKLDRVPKFVQGVKMEFSTNNEEKMFDDFEGELFYNTQFDAPYVLGFDAVFAGVPGSVQCDSIEVEDPDGNKHMINSSGQVGRKGSSFYNKGMLYEQDNLDRLWATMKKIDNSKSIKQTLDYYDSISEKIFPVKMVGGMFDTMWMAMQMKHFSRNYRKKTKLYYDVIKFYAERTKMNVEGIIEATGNQAAIINILDDIAFKGRIMISPERFEQDFGKYYKEICSMISDAGMIPQLHTDGDVTEIIPALQRIGFLGLQGWEGGVDPVYINEHFPDFVVIGFGDVSEVIPFGTTEQVDQHVKELMDALKENRHYVFGPSTVIVKEMPYKNVETFMSAGTKYGTY